MGREKNVPTPVEIDGEWYLHGDKLTCKDCKHYHVEADTGYGDYCALQLVRFDGNFETCGHFEYAPRLFAHLFSGGGSADSAGKRTYAGSVSSSSSPSSTGDTRPAKKPKGCLIWLVLLAAAAVLIYLFLELTTEKPVLW